MTGRLKKNFVFLVKHLTYWIKNEPKVLEDTVFTNRLQIWPSLCKFLNDVQQYLTKINCDKCKLIDNSE